MTFTKLKDDRSSDALDPEGCNNNLRNGRFRRFLPQRPPELPVQTTRCPAMRLLVDCSPPPPQRKKSSLK